MDNRIISFPLGSLNNLSGGGVRRLHRSICPIELARAERRSSNKAREFCNPLILVIHRAVIIPFRNVQRTHGSTYLSLDAGSSIPKLFIVSFRIAEFF